MTEQKALQFDVLTFKQPKRKISYSSYLDR